MCCALVKHVDADTQNWFVRFGVPQNSRIIVCVHVRKNCRTETI